MLLLSVISYLTGFAQDKSTNNILIRNYNEWLKSAQLGKMFLATDVLQHGDTSVLVLKPTDNYTDLQELATDWKYIKEGLSARDTRLEDLLWYKFADYSPLSFPLLVIEIQTTDSSLFDVRIYFDTMVRSTETVQAIRGGDVSINYNFGERADLIHKSYPVKQPTPDLNKYIGLLEAFFKASKHLPQTEVKVTVASRSRDHLLLEIENLYGAATGKKYYEKIRLDITLNNGVTPASLNYWGTVFCAAGILRSSEFEDAAKETDLKNSLLAYNQTLDKVFKTIFHESIQ